MRKLLFGTLSAMVTLAVLLGISGCGLESYLLLNPPTAVSSTASGEFKFKADSTNNEYEFLGFEVYYKFYLTSETPNNSINTFEQLKTDSFLRLNNGGSDTATSISKPLFFSESWKGTSYTVTIDFFNSANPSVDPDAPGRSITGLLRGVIGVGLLSPYDSYFKPFYNYVSADTDITPNLLNDINAGLSVTLALYVLSYGKDSTGLELYSQPVFLGGQSILFSNLPYP
jgi:hypothetical protein